MKKFFLSLILCFSLLGCASDKGIKPSKQTQIKPISAHVLNNPQIKSNIVVVKNLDLIDAKNNVVTVPLISTNGPKTEVRDLGKGKSQKTVKKEEPQLFFVIPDIDYRDIKINIPSIPNQAQLPKTNFELFKEWLSKSKVLGLYYGFIAALATLYIKRVKVKKYLKDKLKEKLKKFIK